MGVVGVSPEGTAGYGRDRDAVNVENMDAENTSPPFFALPFERRQRIESAEAYTPTVGVQASAALVFVIVKVAER